MRNRAYETIAGTHAGRQSLSRSLSRGVVDPTGKPGGIGEVLQLGRDGIRDPDFPHLTRLLLNPETPVSRTSIFHGDPIVTIGLRSGQQAFPTFDGDESFSLFLPQGLDRLRDELPPHFIALGDNRSDIDGDRTVVRIRDFRVGEFGQSDAVAGCPPMGLEGSLLAIAKLKHRNCGVFAGEEVLVRNRQT